jgi:hypothetical protein
VLEVQCKARSTAPEKRPPFKLVFPLLISGLMCKFAGFENDQNLDQKICLKIYPKS